jgi:hypothetical protein
MQEEPRGTYEPNVATPPAEDRVIGGPIGTAYAPERSFGYRAHAGTVVGENVLESKNLVQLGPIVAGLLTTLGTMVVLSVLGLALGASVLDRNAPGEDIGTWAAIWGAASAIVSFFLGGLVAAKSAAVPGPGTGALNGLMVGFAAIALILWLTGTGLGNLFGTLGANFEDITNAVVGQDAAQAVDDAQAQAGQVQDDLRASFDEVRDAAWGTFAGLILPLAAAAFGGWVGHNKRRDLIEGTR